MGFGPGTQRSERLYILLAFQELSFFWGWLRKLKKWIQIILLPDKVINPNHQHCSKSPVGSSKAKSYSADTSPTLQDFFGINVKIHWNFGSSCWCEDLLTDNNRLYGCARTMAVFLRPFSTGTKMPKKSLWSKSNWECQSPQFQHTPLCPHSSNLDIEDFPKAPGCCKHYLYGNSSLIATDSHPLESIPAWIGECLSSAWIPSHLTGRAGGLFMC